MKFITTEELFGNNLYNHLFGMNPDIKEILKLYNLNLDFDMYRIRDCYFVDDVFALVTRIGSNVYVELQEDLKKHPNYLSFDLYDGDTYMTFYFSTESISGLKEMYYKYDNRHVSVKFEQIDYDKHFKEPGNAEKLKEIGKKLEKFFK